MDEGSIIRCRLVISGRHSAVFFQFADKTLYHIVACISHSKNRVTASCCPVWESQDASLIHEFSSGAFHCHTLCRHIVFPALFLMPPVQSMPAHEHDHLSGREKEKGARAVRLHPQADEVLFPSLHEIAPVPDLFPFF